MNIELTEREILILKHIIEEQRTVMVKKLLDNGYELKQALKTKVINDIKNLQNKLN